jgi:histidine triad (HIT) family protein
MEDCVFCSIANGRIKSDIVYSDDNVVAFNDIAPQAPVHIVVIPKVHVERVEDVSDHSIFEKVFKAINTIIAKDQSIRKGFRIVVNSGKLAGQSVDHIHFHVLSGRPMNWPPG